MIKIHKLGMLGRIIISKNGDTEKQKRLFEHKESSKAD